MKQVLMIAAIIFSVSVNAQKDTTQKLEIPGDSIPLMSVKQINQVLQEMRKAMSIEQSGLYEMWQGKLQNQINLSVIEWRNRKKKN